MFKKLLLVFPIICLGSVKNNINSIPRNELAETNFFKSLTNTSLIDTTKNKKDFHFSDIIDSKNEVFNSISYKRSKFLFLANIAQSYRLASSPDGLNSEQKKYFRDLKSGISYDLTAYYVKDGRNGFGVKYNVYQSSGTIKNQSIILNDGTVISGAFSDDISITFIGPSIILSENESARTGEANLELAIGYIGYQNDSKIIGNPLKITGGNLGMIGGMGYHFRLAPNFLIGPQVNFIGGMLKKLKYTYADGTSETIKLNEEEYENLWRIDLAIGAKLRF
ncbi:hypothetical protein [Flavobacterium polysaccharolyticum]|uniref:Outer membrane protein beta-barrel domain-containing protein n=1 Tax=Flavobacterium polysaccharolyticum TaxID=3133148 RepID=A0ABU9NUR0_9FLAO